MSVSAWGEPARNLLLDVPERLDFLDTRTVELPVVLTPLQAWDRLVAEPLPGLALAFRVRDMISAQFGVTRIGGFSGGRPVAPQVGDKLDFFLIEAISDTALVLTARDRHLDVMTSLWAEGRQFGITSSVRVHNRFGRAYMIPVRPAHRLIVRILMGRLERGLRRGHPAEA